MKLELCNYVTTGFQVLTPSLADFVSSEFKNVYGKQWWDAILNLLNDQYNLPYDGYDDELMGYLDIANCIRLIDRGWKDVFDAVLDRKCRSFVKELMGVRNIVSHIGGNDDLDIDDAERALNTMYFLCKEYDMDTADEIYKIYSEVRNKNGVALPESNNVGIQQPETTSKRGASKGNTLIDMDGSEYVQKTTLTRKVQIDGQVRIYPVYRVKLDKLYYNDQNDRIATWISHYESENGKDSLSELNQNTYNRIIENFIYASNPDSIHKTQKNIGMIGQREPGVTLADGRIVDGNRRFTCLRRLNRESDTPLYFETVLLDLDIYEDKKQIKLLELSIQHGEEKKVDYDQIDYAIGTYRDIVQTQLLTKEEYAASTNEPLSEVKIRLEVAYHICDFLNYINLPEHYHIARDYQVYSIFQEMMAPLRKLKDEDKEILKKIVFNNTIMKAIPDQRKFIRDIKKLVSAGAYSQYFEEQMDIGERIMEKYNQASIHNKQDIDEFALNNTLLVNELQESMEKALQIFRSQQLKLQPAENITKCINLLMDIDPRLFDKLSLDEIEEIKSGLSDLSKIISKFQELL